MVGGDGFGQHLRHGKSVDAQRVQSLQHLAAEVASRQARPGRISGVGEPRDFDIADIFQIAQRGGSLVVGDLAARVDRSLWKKRFDEGGVGPIDRQHDRVWHVRSEFLAEQGQHIRRGIEIIIEHRRAAGPLPRAVERVPESLLQRRVARYGNDVAGAIGVSETCELGRFAVDRQRQDIYIVRERRAVIGLVESEQPRARQIECERGLDVVASERAYDQRRAGVVSGRDCRQYPVIAVAENACLRLAACRARRGEIAGLDGLRRPAVGGGGQGQD